MYTGEFWLEYDEGDDEEHWRGRVTSCVIRCDQIAVEFSGQHSNYGAFQGNCNLHKEGALFIGCGTFTVGKEGGTAPASGCFRKLATPPAFGDSSVYDLAIELSAANRSVNRTPTTARARAR